MPPKTIEERLAATLDAGERWKLSGIAGIAEYAMRSMGTKDLVGVESLIAPDERGAFAGWDVARWDAAVQVDPQMVCLVLESLRVRVEDVGAVGFVEEPDLRPEIAGAICFRAEPEWMRTPLDVIHLAVHPSLRRQGLGRMILGGLILTLGDRPMVRCPLHDTQLSGHQFLAACGFRGASSSCPDVYLFEAGAPASGLVEIRGACPMEVR